MKKKMAIVTATRAEYGILKPLIKKILLDDILILQVIVTGTHLSEKYGNTQQEILDDGIRIFKRIPILTDGNTGYDVSVTMAHAIVGFAQYFCDEHPDVVIVLGDRTEILGVCCAAMNAHIPIAHLHGGEITEGAVDDCVRHAVTKMSYLHFVANELYRKRIIQMGENPNRVFNVGALGVENVFNTVLLTKEEICKQIGISLEQKFVMVTFHPITMESQEKNETQLYNLIAAMEIKDQYFYVITMANADMGGNWINTIFKEYSSKHKNALFISSLGMLRYLSAIKYCEFVLGNSSSGIIEAPALGVPVIDVGDRQKGRMMADTIIHCKAETQEIIQAIEQAPKVKHCVSYIYGDGHSSNKIADILYKFLEKKNNTAKKFFDL